MGKAEPGSTKYLSNKMKQKGLTRLRWYCQICEKACRDENAFKMHCQSESHTRRALDAGQNFKGIQEEYSRQFLTEFVAQLRTAHGEKSVHANRFYQEVIARRDHVHLNATRWHSLTDFVKHISREGIVRAEEKEDGIFIAWIDDSPEAMKRREAVRRKEMQDKGDEEREQMMLREQIKRAQRDAAARGEGAVDGAGEDGEDQVEFRGEASEEYDARVECYACAGGRYVGAGGKCQQWRNKEGGGRQTSRGNNAKTGIFEVRRQTTAEERIQERVCRRPEKGHGRATEEDERGREDHERGARAKESARIRRRASQQETAFLVCSSGTT